MKIGTKSVLFGAHCFFIHPFFVAWAWWRLYGFPTDPRLWVAFFVHDLGYWGLPNMDGVEGEDHVIWGAEFMHRFYDPVPVPGRPQPLSISRSPWFTLCLCHSRYMAKRYGLPPSRLCYADKLAFVLTPAIVYLPCVWLTGEWREYARAHDHECHGDGHGLLHWYFTSRAYVDAWVKEFVNSNNEGKTDTWTQMKPKTPNETNATSVLPNPLTKPSPRPTQPPTSPGHQPPDV